MKITIRDTAVAVTEDLPAITAMPATIARLSRCASPTAGWTLCTVHPIRASTITSACAIGILRYYLGILPIQTSLNKKLFLHVEDLGSESQVHQEVHVEKLTNSRNRVLSELNFQVQVLLWILHYTPIDDMPNKISRNTNRFVLKINFYGK